MWGKRRDGSATLTILSQLCATARSRRSENTQSCDSMAEETKTMNSWHLAAMRACPETKGLCACVCLGGGGASS